MLPETRPFLDADFPGYAEAVARENIIRSAACLGLNEKICGLEVKPLTAFHVRWLVLTRSPFMSKFPIDALVEKTGIVNDVTNFLWIVSPMFKPGSMTAGKLKRWFDKITFRRFENPRDKFNRLYSPVLKERADVICKAIQEYMDEAYIDAEESTPSASNDKSYWAFEIGIAHEMYEHYRYRIDFWNNPPAEKNPVHVPLKLIFQLRKFRAKWSDPKALVTNRSEQLISEGLARINAIAKRLKEYEQEILAAPPMVSGPRMVFETDYQDN
jgi:hypothetical protein